METIDERAHEHRQTRLNAAAPRDHSLALQALTVTESELRRRVDQALDKAIDKPERETLVQALAFMQARFGSTSGGIGAAFVPTDEYVGMVRWFVSQYGDLVEDVRVVLRVPGPEVSNDLLHRQQMVARWLDVKATCPPPQHVPAAAIAGTQDHADTPLWIEMRGSALQSLRIRIKRMLTQKANAWAQQSNDKEISTGSQMLQVRLFVESRLALCPDKPVQAGTGAVGDGLQFREVGLEAEDTKPVTKLARPLAGLPEDARTFADMVRARADWFGRQISCRALVDAGGIGSELSRRLTEATKSGDPVDVAALCQLLWMHGQPVRLKKASSVGESPHDEMPAQPAKDHKVSAKWRSEVDADYITTTELSQRMGYDERTIRERLRVRHMIEGVHFIKPFGRKTLYVWSAIKRDFLADAGQG